MRSWSWWTRAGRRLEPAGAGRVGRPRADRPHEPGAEHRRGVPRRPGHRRRGGGPGGLFPGRPRRRGPRGHRRARPGDRRSPRPGPGRRRQEARGSGHGPSREHPRRRACRHRRRGHDPHRLPADPHLRAGRARPGPGARPRPPAARRALPRRSRRPWNLPAPSAPGCPRRRTCCSCSPAAPAFPETSASSSLAGSPREATGPGHRLGGSLAGRRLPAAAGCGPGSGC